MVFSLPHSRLSVWWANWWESAGTPTRLPDSPLCGSRKLSRNSLSPRKWKIKTVFLHWCRARRALLHEGLRTRLCVRGRPLLDTSAGCFWCQSIEQGFVCSYFGHGPNRISLRKKAFKRWAIRSKNVYVMIFLSTSFKCPLLHVAHCGLFVPYLVAVLLRKKCDNRQSQNHFTHAAPENALGVTSGALKLVLCITNATEPSHRLW